MDCATLLWRLFLLVLMVGEKPLELVQLYSNAKVFLVKAFVMPTGVFFSEKN